MILRFRLIPYAVLIFLLPLRSTVLFGQSWELARDSEGIRVYLRTIEGSAFKEFKGETRVESRLSSLVALLADSDSYPRWMHNCMQARLLQIINPTTRWTYVLNHAPWPARNRDLIMSSVLHQEENGSVTIALQSISGAMPEQENIVRVRSARGFWIFRPVNTSTTDVTYQMHIDPGGQVPAAAVNSSAVENPFRTLKNLITIIRDSKYRGAVVPGIRELQN